MIYGSECIGKIAQPVAVEYVVMRGPVVTGIRTTHDCPVDYPMWGSNGRTSGEIILWNEHTGSVGGVPSLGGQYITTLTHNLNHPAEGGHIQIGFFTLTLVQELFAIKSLMYAMHCLIS